MGYYSMAEKKVLENITSENIEFTQEGPKGHEWGNSIHNSKYDPTLYHDVWDFTIFSGHKCTMIWNGDFCPVTVHQQCSTKA